MDFSILSKDIISGSELVKEPLTDNPINVTSSWVFFSSETSVHSDMFSCIYINYKTSDPQLLSPLRSGKALFCILLVGRKQSSSLIAAIRRGWRPGAPLRRSLFLEHLACTCFSGRYAAIENFAAGGLSSLNEGLCLRALDIVVVKHLLFAFLLLTL